MTDASGPKVYPIVVSKETESFTFPSDTAPEMVLFDKGNQILKSVGIQEAKERVALPVEECFGSCRPCRCGCGLGQNEE